MILNNDNKYRGNLGNSLKLDEYSKVEKPLMEQLIGLGWNNADNKVIELQMQQTPDQSFRSSFSEVVLLPKLRSSLKKINPFLTDGQIDEVVRKMITFTKSSLLENNQQVLNLLLENTTVSKNEQTGELSPTVRFVDFENVENVSCLNFLVRKKHFKI